MKDSRPCTRRQCSKNHKPWTKDTILKLYYIYDNTTKKPYKKKIYNRKQDCSTAIKLLKRWQVVSLSVGVLETKDLGSIDHVSHLPLGSFFTVPGGLYGYTPDTVFRKVGESGQLKFASNHQAKNLQEYITAITKGKALLIGKEITCTLKESPLTS